MNETQNIKLLENFINDCQLHLQYLDEIFKEDYYQVSSINFFNFLRETMIDSLLLKVVRLFDNHEMGKYKNFTLENIITSEHFEFSSQLKKDIEVALGEIKKSLEELKYYRNKKIAHIDYNEVSDNIHSYKIKIEHIEKCIKVLHEARNKLRKDLEKNELYTKVIDSSAGVMSFLHILSLGSFLEEQFEKNTSEIKDIKKSYIKWRQEKRSK